MIDTAGSPVLTPRQRGDYHELGFLLVRDFFPRALMAEAAEEAEALLARRDLIDAQNLRCRFMSNVRTGACEFECFDPVIDIGPVCRRIAHDANLLALLGELYGEEA